MGDLNLDEVLTSLVTRFLQKIIEILEKTNNKLHRVSCLFPRQYHTESIFEIYKSVSVDFSDTSPLIFQILLN